MSCLGDELESMCKGAVKDVFIAVPFIKRPALSRLLQVISLGIKITVVVRFRSEDLACGVTDFEIVSLLLARENTEVFMHQALHAKIFRVDECAMIGSANLTSRALGWCAVPNIELLMKQPATTPCIAAIEQQLRGTSVRLTAELAEIVRAAIPDVSERRYEEILEVEKTWIPECPRPDLMWDVYSTGDAKTMI